MKTDKGRGKGEREEDVERRKSRKTWKTDGYVDK